MLICSFEVNIEFGQSRISRSQREVRSILREFVP